MPKWSRCWRSSATTLMWRWLTTNASLSAQFRLAGCSALLHEEHVDEILRRAGVGAAHPSPTEAHETIKAFRARIPWLALGLLGGMLAGGVASMFEESLKREVTLAFFLPLVVYMADAIGTQTETILVRRMVYGRVSLFTQLWREASLGC